MKDKKGLLTKVGDAVEAARDRAQKAGTSLVKRAKVAASDARRRAGNLLVIGLTYLLHKRRVKREGAPGDVPAA